MVGFGVGGTTRKTGYPERFMFDMEKSFGRVKSYSLVLVTYSLIQKVPESPVRACFATPCYW